MRPHLLLDVDGVLCPFPGDQPEGYERYEPTLSTRGWDGLWVWVSEANKGRLATLSQHFDLTWATMWEDEANNTLLEVHDLTPLPVVYFDHRHSHPDSEHYIEGYPEIIGIQRRFSGYSIDPGIRTFKLPFIKAWADHHKVPLAWIDDDMDTDVFEWAEARTEDGLPTLAIRTDPNVGLTDDHVVELEAWVEREL